MLHRVYKHFFSLKEQRIVNKQLRHYRKHLTRHKKNNHVFREVTAKLLLHARVDVSLLEPTWRYCPETGSSWGMCSKNNKSSGHPCPMALLQVTSILTCFTMIPRVRAYTGRSTSKTRDGSLRNKSSKLCSNNRGKLDLADSKGRQTSWPLFYLTDGPRLLWHPSLLLHEQIRLTEDEPEKRSHNSIEKTMTTKNQYVRSEDPGFQGGDGYGSCISNYCYMKPGRNIMHLQWIFFLCLHM